jgi:hypothetical protein
MTLVLAALAALAQDAATIEDLIRRLGDEEFAAREQATEELRKIGKPAEEALRKAAGSDDPEVRTRAKGLLEELSRPKTPDRPRRPAAPGFPPGLGLRGGSVQVQTINGDSTYVLTPGDGTPPLTFRRFAAGPVKLEYRDAEGKDRSVEAESLEKFLKEHADLAARYGVTAEGIEYGGARVTFQGNGFPRGFDFGFGRRPLRPAAPPEARPGFEPLTEAMRAQLGIPDGEGLVVTRDEAAPGLRKNDILLEVDGRAVTGTASVRELLRKECVLTVLRKGRRETIRPARKDY